MRWPRPLSHRLPLQNILERPRNKVIVSPTPEIAREKILRAFDKVRAKGIDPRATTVFVDIGASRRFEQFQVGMSPCLTHSRCQVGGVYISTHNRKCTIDEMFRLQGINPKKRPMARFGNLPVDHRGRRRQCHVGECLGTVAAPCRVRSGFAPELATGQVGGPEAQSIR